MRSFSRTAFPAGNDLEVRANGPATDKSGLLPNLDREGVAFQDQLFCVEQSGSVVGHVNAFRRGDAFTDNKVAPIVDHTVSPYWVNYGKGLTASQARRGRADRTVSDPMAHRQLRGACCLA